MSQPLLSVIVPCYNVENYLDKCVSSIVAQTYSNLEIILVNDGSADNTGQICDAWQTKDRRIRVIHKQNEGNSYARKTGIDNATAEYLSFIDADDWIDSGMYAGMMPKLLDTGSDIAQCGVCLVYEDGRMEDWDNENERIVGRIEGVLLIMESKKWLSWIWNKIFKKHLFDNVVFPKGRGCAGDFVTLFAFHHANQCVCLPDVYYYYLQRTGSISRFINIHTEVKNHCDFFEAWYERYSFVEQHPEYHNALPSVKLRVLRLGIFLLRNIIAIPQYFTVDADKLFDTTSKRLCSISLIRKDKLQRTFKIELYALKFGGAKCYKFFKLSYNCIIKITNRLKITNRRNYFLLDDMWNCLSKDL